MAKVASMVFTNTAKVGIFTRQGCGLGEVGGAVTYTVDAGKYTSTISQADADAKAQADISSNGQAYANSVGSCYFLTPSSLSTSFVSEGGTQNLSMASNISWEATSSSSWITVSPPTAAGASSLTITCSANGGEERKGTVVVQSSSSDGGIRREILITQEGRPYLTVDQEMLELDPYKGVALVAVSSSRSWTVSSVKGAFITAVKIDDETLSVRSPRNSTSSIRFGSITISNGSITKTIEVTQETTYGQPLNPKGEVAQ
jgi:hypothetical protein